MNASVTTNAMHIINSLLFSAEKAAARATATNTAAKGFKM